jgi:hypothetical protein
MAAAALKAAGSKWLPGWSRGGGKIGAEEVLSGRVSVGVGIEKRASTSSLHRMIHEASSSEGDVSVQTKFFSY